MHSMLLATASGAAWTFNTGVVMVVCNLIVIAVVVFGKVVKQSGAGPSLPLPIPGFGVPELLAATSFGHILGAGMILGLRAAGSL